MKKTSSPQTQSLLQLETALKKELHLLVKDLKRVKKRIVFAESCTGGMIASFLSETPGVSDVFCGSQVVYRNHSKTSWLHVSPKTLRTHSEVSQETVHEMVEGLLLSTPEAQVGAAITGYLGPKGKKLGQVFIAAQIRGQPQPLIQELSIYPELNPKGLQEGTHLRLKRRAMSARFLIFLVRTLLK